MLVKFIFKYEGEAFHEDISGGRPWIGILLLKICGCAPPVDVLQREAERHVVSKGPRLLPVHAWRRSARHFLAFLQSSLLPEHTPGLILQHDRLASHHRQIG